MRRNRNGEGIAIDGKEKGAPEDKWDMNGDKKIIGMKKAERGEEEGALFEEGVEVCEEEVEEVQGKAVDVAVAVEEEDMEEAVEEAGRTRMIDGDVTHITAQGALGLH